MGNGTENGGYPNTQLFPLEAKRKITFPPFCKTNKLEQNKEAQIPNSGTK